jgi:protein involved in polysaccharide export with SLBB domain
MPIDRFPIPCGLLLLFAGASVSCAVTPPSEVNEKYRAVLEQRHNQYVLKPGDVLTIQLFARPDTDLNQPGMLVLPDGRSDLFFMHNHRLEGMSLPDVLAEYRTRIAEEFPDADPRIQVVPSDEVVYMVGQFERPATLPLRNRMTLQEAISAVNGMAITGDTDYALLRRPYLNPRHPDLFRIDLNDESEAIFLLPGDQVILQRNFAATAIAYLREFVFGVLPGQLYSFVAGAAL